MTTAFKHHQLLRHLLQHFLHLLLHHNMSPYHWLEWVMVIIQTRNWHAAKETAMGIRIVKMVWFAFSKMLWKLLLFPGVLALTLMIGTTASSPRLTNLYWLC
jgi:hypothetical protein